MTRNRTPTKFVVCVWNEGYEASLQLLRIYQQIPDARASRHGLIRVIDEDGEDYLCPEDFFVRLDLPKQAEEAVESAAELEAQRR